MKIRLIKKNGLHWLRSSYNDKTRTVTVFHSGKNFNGFFNILSHELGHHNFQIKLEKMPLWRRIVSKLINEHEYKACKQEGRIVELSLEELKE